MNSKIFRGTFTALITPFKKDFSVDFSALENLIEKQIEAGIDGIVSMGTTGESPTLSISEHSTVVKFTVEKVAGRAKVIAGAGSNSTAEALELSKNAARDCADGLLIVSPYYNKPTPRGLRDYFSTIARAVDLPQIIYNIPGRCGVNLATADLKILAEQNSNIVAVKEASGSISQMTEVLENLPENFSVLSGDDNLTFPLLSLGGDGVISVLSNFLPAETKKMCDEFFAGNFETARKIHFKLLPKMRACFLETNPIPIKTLHFLRGDCENVFRSPMTPAENSTVEKLRRIFGI